MIPLVTTDDGKYHYAKVDSPPKIYEKYGIPNTAIVAGGLALAILVRRCTSTRLNFGDIDIWLPNGIEYTPNAELVNESEWAYSYVLNTQFLWTQIMKRRYDNPLELLRNFDLTLCKVAFIGNEVWYHDDVLNYILTGGVRCSVDNGQYNLRRMNKYAKKFGRPLTKVFSEHDLQQVGLTKQSTPSEVAEAVALANRENYETNEGLL